MACSPLNARKSHFHARSNSLPTRHHPLISQIDEHLRRLFKASKAATTSASCLSKCINCLADLYNLFNSVLLLSQTQQALAHECSESQIDGVLDRSLRMMDLCGTTKDSLCKIRDETQELQSTLRRRRGDECRLAIEVGEYFISRKKSNKAIHKSLRDLKSICKISSMDSETMAIIDLLREVEEATLTVFESLLSYTSATKAQPSGWSLVSKLLHSKRISSDENATATGEFEKVDAELYSILIHQKARKSSSGVSAENALNMLGNLEVSIQELEQGLECLHRCLIKTRVSLLNTTSH